MEYSIQSKIYSKSVLLRKTCLTQGLSNFFCKIYRITDDPVFWADRNFAQVRAILSRKPIRQCAMLVFCVTVQLQDEWTINL